LTAFSQTDTTVTKKIDTSFVSLPKAVAVQVIKDLVTKDYLVEENKLLTSTNILLTNNILLKDSLLQKKDSIVSLYIQKESYFTKTLEMKDLEIHSYKSTQSILIKENSKLNKKLSFSRGLIISVLVLMSTLFAIK